MSSPKEEVDSRLLEITDCLYRLSVKAIVIRDRKLLLTLEHGNDWWSLPGGGVDYGETISQSLARELSEELGVAPENIRADKVPILVTTHAVVDKIPRAILFYRTHIIGGLTGSTSNIKTYGWYSAEELKDLALSPSVSKIADELIGFMR